MAKLALPLIFLKRNNKCALEIINLCAADV